MIDLTKKFPNVKNIRDVGNIKNKDGFELITKRIIRSGDLKALSKSELNTFHVEYNLKYIVDFRSTRSFRKKPDKIDDSIKILHYYSLEELEYVTYDINIEKPYEFYVNMYKLLARKEEAAKSFEVFLKTLLLLKDNESICYHCTSGKDRTGIATTILLNILDFDRETIYKEYQNTEKFYDKEYKEELNKLTNPSKHDLEYLESFYLCKKEYLDAFYETINEEFGNFDLYVKNILHISEEEIKELKRRFLK